MKLIIYNDNNEIVESIEVNNPVITSDLISWDNGSMSLPNLPYIILDDTIEVGEDVNEVMISQDRKSDFVKLSLEEENAVLKEKLNQMEEKTNFHENILVELASVLYS